MLEPSSNQKPSPVWELSAVHKKNTNLWHFAEETRLFHGANPADYESLHAWSVASPEAFFHSLWDYLEIKGDKREAAFVPGEDIRTAQFFPNACVNYAENLLQGPDDRVAIIAHREDGTRRQLTRRQLYEQVSCLVQAMLKDGVNEGDRVAAIVTNDVEALVAYLATSSIGAIWASCSPDFGEDAAVDRLCQVEPKILFAVSQYSYGGKVHDVIPTICAVAAQCELKNIIVISSNDGVSSAHVPVPVKSWRDYLHPFSPCNIPFKRLPFHAPLTILFSSGTTGKPKCIVHSAMGLLLQHKKELVLHCDLKPDEKMFYFSTCGWMMWNWQITALAVGVTLVTYDGNPFYSNPERFVEIIDDEGVEVFGTSAKYIQECQKAALKPVDSHKLLSLRMVLSTGSPLLSSSFDYIYQNWKKDVHLASISGGTDICACFLGGNPLLPVYRAELQCAILGMDVDVFDDEGNSIKGTSGELVCKNSHVSMPLSFLKDEFGHAYHNAYFKRFPGLWAHGDYAMKSSTGGYVIKGRSDTTLNPGGVRIGSAEIYRQVERIRAIEDCVVVGQSWQEDQRIILFVQMHDVDKMDESLVQEIRANIRQGASPRHVPAHIFSVKAIPRTRSGKVSEVAVQNIVNDRPVQNRNSLENPEVLKEYVKIKERYLS